MVVSGVPIKLTHHAEPMAAMALDMKEVVRNLKDPSNNNSLTVTIGLCSSNPL